MINVMVLEDDDAIKCLYEQVLSRDKYDVTFANDGLAAVDILRNKKPDVVVLDIRIPGMDGIDLLGKALDMEAGPPVIINKAYSMHKGNFLKWMADAYEINSSDLSGLVPKIKKLLGK
jgi:DNA-binding response OmpR family regulator